MDRYSRQLLYKNIGKDGQKKLEKSTACIVGVGALGTVCSELFARAGVNLILVDRDEADITNLQRQILFGEEDVGRNKAEAAKEKLSIINSSIQIESYAEELSKDNIDAIIGHPSIILGCTDNLKSRFLINDYALKNKIPWVFGAVAADKGYVFDITGKGPCLSCIYPRGAQLTCDTVGVLNSASVIIASVMAKEAIKIIMSKKPEQKLMHIDVWNTEITKIEVEKKKSCPACNGKYLYLESKD